MNDVLEWLEVIDNTLPRPPDPTQFAIAEQSVADALSLAFPEDAGTAAEERALIFATTVLESWLSFERKRLETLRQAQREQAQQTLQPTDDQQALVDRLLGAASIQQRTAEWYAHAQNVLTASEFWTIFKTPRARGQLVAAKASTPQVRPQNALCVPSEFMSAFDWGIRFEPVVKLIYEHKHAAKIADLGRITHPTDPRIAASPDGLIVSGGRKGRLIEIKCPTTREIDGKIPDEYYAQMQLQMEVTGAETCDYVEVRFRSPTNPKTAVFAGPGLMSGVIWRIQRDEADRCSERYEYGAIGTTEPPAIDQCEAIMEVIPWELLGWHEVPVSRNREWWRAVQPAVDAFWADVALAREGKFTVPEGRRRAAAAAPAGPVCMIMETTDGTES